MHCVLDTFITCLWSSVIHQDNLKRYNMLLKQLGVHLEAHFSTVPLSVVCDSSIHHISRLKWLLAKSTQWSIVQIEPATFCTAAWVGSNLISRAVCGSGVWRCPWARRLTLTAPEELTVALRGWLCHHCVNGWMLAYIVKHWLATS